MSKASRPTTLAIDIGGTNLKAGLLSPGGHLTADPVRARTPHPATPDPVIALLEKLARPLGEFQRISIGFPGAVRDGRVLTAPNLDIRAWRGYPLAAAIGERLGAATRIANDATVQGLGVIRGQAIECVITLGTGFGFALFDNGRPAPHLELSQHPVHGEKTYDQYLGDAALRKIGGKRWTRRLREAIALLATLSNFDALYIGGGNSRHVQGELPNNVHVVSNEAGITGGVKPWDARLNDWFAATDPEIREP